MVSEATSAGIDRVLWTEAEIVARVAEVASELATDLRRLPEPAVVMGRRHGGRTLNRQLTDLVALLFHHKLEDAFCKEANAICEECDAQFAAKSQDEELKEVEEEESLVLACDDDSLPPAISIAADSGEFEDAFWKVNAISKEHHATSSAKCQEEMKEVDGEDGSAALCVDFPPVISITEGGEVVDAFLGEVDAIREGHAALSAANGQEEPGEMELEMEEDEACSRGSSCAPRWFGHSGLLPSTPRPFPLPLPMRSSPWVTLRS